jgi:hypothetical protein
MSKATTLPIPNAMIFQDNATGFPSLRPDVAFDLKHGIRRANPLSRSDRFIRPDQSCGRAAVRQRFSNDIVSQPDQDGVLDGIVLQPSRDDIPKSGETGSRCNSVWWTFLRSDRSEIPIFYEPLARYVEDHRKVVRSCGGGVKVERDTVFR